MMQATKVSNVTFVNGVAVNDISTDDLVFQVQTIENEIAELGKIGTKSKTIDAIKAKHEKSLAAVVALLDERKV